MYGGGNIDLWDAIQSKSYAYNIFRVITIFVNGPRRVFFLLDGAGRGA